MNAVSNYSHSARRFESSAAALQSVSYTPTRRRPVSPPQKRPVRSALHSLKAIRFYMLCTVVLISFFTGMAVHMVSGDDEVQAATISADRTASVNAGSGAVATAAAVPEKPAREQVLVVPGDTLWSIAEAHAPHGKDVRGYIQQLKQVNHLASSALQAGQLLILP